MFRKRTRSKGGNSETKTAGIFLNKCFRLVAWWIAILILMVGFVVVINIRGDAKVWAGTLFTVSCVLDIFITLRAIPIILKVLKDDLSKESHVRRTIWKLRFLMVINLLLSLSFVAWVWLAKDENTGMKIIKWLMGSILALWVVFVKCFFAYTCIKLKRYISKLFVEFTVLEREDPTNPSETTTFTPSNDLLETKPEEVKSLT